MKELATTEAGANRNDAIIVIKDQQANNIRLIVLGSLSNRSRAELIAKVKNKIKTITKVCIPMLTSRPAIANKGMLWLKGIRINNK